MIRASAVQELYEDNSWWEHTIVDLLDGGTCAFGADFNITGSVLTLT